MGSTDANIDILHPLTEASQWAIMSCLEASSWNLAWSLRLAAWDACSPKCPSRARRHDACAWTLHIERRRRYCCRTCLASKSKSDLPYILSNFLLFSWENLDRSECVKLTHHNTNQLSKILEAFFQAGPTSCSPVPKYCLSILWALTL